jgi:hypothetical protein
LNKRGEKECQWERDKGRERLSGRFPEGEVKKNTNGKEGREGKDYVDRSGRSPEREVKKNANGKERREGKDYLEDYQEEK